KRARITFTSKEAEPYLRKRLKQISDDDLVWASNDNPNHAKVNEANRIREYCAKAGLNERYEGNNRHKITTHSFRAFFITKLSRHDENFAKKLAGQKGYLLQYDRMTEEEKLEKYIEFEPDLLIFDESKKNAEIQCLKKEKSELEHYKEKVDQLWMDKLRMEHVQKAMIS
ncbi:MAG: site-specific integrase, partial [Thaumarchaeota archaeon]|nr:site-specific integrase [Nitrososphaerota archaeon]